MLEPMRNIRLLVLCAAAMTLAGCAEEPPAAKPRRGAPQPPSAVAAPTPAPKPVVAPPKAVAAKNAEPYRPPFPQRTELFLPPNPAAAARSSRRSVAPDVVLKGIVKVDVPKAVVQVGGQIHSISAKQEKGGVRVVSIDPPRVTLERGEQRWTASLYETR
jgi:hypothetical protein